MFHRYGWRLAGVALAVLLSESPAQAQVWIGRRPGGIVVQAPYAPPISVGVGVAPIRPYLLPRRRLLGELYYGAAPAYPAPQAAAVQAAPRYAAARQMLPTDAALRAMNDSELLNAAVSAVSQLDSDLARFDTGAQWQSYLRFPPDALPAPTNNQVTLNLDALERTLARFNKIAGDSEYGMIAELGSFDASRSALAEIVRRFGAGRQASQPQPRDDAPNAELEEQVEELPGPAPASHSVQRQPAGQAPAPLSPPQLAAPANAPVAEQSILVK